jgi:rod shape-determining protein MreD
VTSMRYALTVIFSLMLALVLQLIPVSADWLPWKPNFLLLMVIGWVIFKPSQWGIGFAASVGLLADLVFRSPLGLHVFLFVFIGAAPYLLSGWLIYFNVIHRCFFVFILIIFSELLGNFMYSVWWVPVDYRDVPWGAISSAVIWPFMDKFLVNVHNNRR